MTINASETSETADGLSDGARTFISFLLFAHLFALGVAVLSNFGPVSPLRNQLDAAFLGPYLQMLHMDVGYNFHLVDSSELDAPLTLEIESPAADPNQTDAGQFPESVGPNLRAARYYQLMLNVDLMQDDETAQGDLPRQIARRLFAERDISSGQHRLRLRRHLLASREAWSEAGGAPDLFAADRFRTIYEADVSFFRGDLMLIKQEAAAESAIVRPANP